MMIIRLLILTILVTFTLSKPFKLLRNIQTQLSQMIEQYQLGDTSHAFSIAIKISLAIKTLHSDLSLSHPQIEISNEAVNCQQELNEIVKIAKSETWQENVQIMMNRISKMQQKCTNSDFAQLSSQITSGFQNQCAICVVVLRVIQNYVDYHKMDVADFVSNQLCSLFGSDVKPTCEAFIHFAGPVIIATLTKKEPSDKVCLLVGICKNKECRIVKQKIEEYEIDLEQVLAASRPAPWKWLVHLFKDHFGDQHLPVFDLDNDTYSDVSTFRGYNWRGSDCNQMQSGVYPGRKKGSKWVDYDCNGIFGLDNRGRFYQDKFCLPYKRLGVAVIGDSAGAHFQLPQKYLNVTMITNTSYLDILPRLADELDLPQDSTYTGHRNTTYNSRSIYKYLRSWNLCNNNDYQNIGVNGGSAGNTRNNIKALSRDSNNDYPLLMFLQLIGNDVCKKSFQSMTKEWQFEQSVNELLTYLDEKVPEGSHLIILGLGDGSVLYENLVDDMHPLNVTYGDMYQFLNCLKISPCWGWLNSNETVRRFATQRAQNLSKVYQKILKERTFKNFDTQYYDFPADQILERKVTQGGDPKSMYQRCDGFHPNGEFNAYLADWLWYKIRKDHPDWIGEKNPHNPEIKNMFGLFDLH